MTKSWSPSAVFQQIQSSEKSVSECLERLRHDGLLEANPENNYRISQADPVTVKTIRDLALAYRDRRVSVIECIYKKPADPVQDFIKAFRWRKEE